MASLLHCPGVSKLCPHATPRCRCVEALEFWGSSDRGDPRLSPVVMGAIIMTQASSIQQLKTNAAALTGADVAILVSFDGMNRAIDHC